MTIETPLEWLLLVATAVSSVLAFFLGRRGRQIETTTRDQLEVSLPAILQDLQYYKRRSKELFDTIEGVLGERDRWRELYNDQASGHDNAQALMMDTIHNLARAYQGATGKAPRLDPLIEAVRNDFVRVHGPEARSGSDKEIQEGKAPSVLAPVEAASDKESTDGSPEQP